MGKYHLSSVKDRLINSIKVDIRTGCWNWTECFTRGGYGNISIYGIQTRAHRVSYAFFKKAIPGSMFVLHKCDNPSCINPEHLFLGTQQDNMDDMVIKGRQGKGNSKLTEEDVKDIRLLLDTTNTTMTRLGEMFGVCANTIGRIHRRKIWRHL